MYGVQLFDENQFIALKYYHLSINHLSIFFKIIIEFLKEKMKWSKWLYKPLNIHKFISIILTQISNF